ncbi:hypothetical protein RhiXN_09629 [Rhizoctonia solani]|uniref:Calcium channel YVC1-like C-terminal transmembrane domain-containing protein n=1 Tax=Rhizoctonia solani TaxID=456999 RepID=A0A8H8P0E3_9AGAM|nr:uncharacterized protein RhiXN_09629 [Rhizoctonia solani]QRW22042.1 hypothetical protein RhiXN_09629 [Rhizoctonia solani]
MATTQLSQSQAALDHADSASELATVCTGMWPIIDGAPMEIRIWAQDNMSKLYNARDRFGNAIDMAITGKARHFTMSLACQTVIDAIYWGRIVYPASSQALNLSSAHEFEVKPVQFYDPYQAPLLNHERLTVPVIRGALGCINSVILLILFVIAFELNEKPRVNWAESLFIIYALGFVAEKLAAIQEHGIGPSSATIWNMLDLGFALTYSIYSGFRIVGILCNSPWARNLGHDMLALNAFVILSSSTKIIAMRLMLLEFIASIAVAAFCFGGILYALHKLGEDTYSLGEIARWMFDIWLGLDSSGLDQASEFHPQLGPFLMVSYACLSNIFLLTLIFSFISHTFGKMSKEAEMEALFQRAVLAIEGAKINIILQCQPPMNLLAFLIAFPAKFILPPTWIIILAVSFYERNRAAKDEETIFEKAVAAAKWLVAWPRRLRRITRVVAPVDASRSVQVIFALDDELAQNSDSSGSWIQQYKTSAMRHRAQDPMNDGNKHIPPKEIYSQNSTGTVWIALN